MAKGGYRPGSGRPMGSTGEKVLAVRRLYQKHIAREARRAWRIAQRRFRLTKDPSDDPGSQPPKDDEDAAIGFLVRLQINAGLKGDRAILQHLDERCSGKVRIELEQSGPEGGPIPMEVIGGFTYVCELQDGQAAFAPAKAVPGRPDQERKA